jgi:hypothetical protein
MTFEHNYVKLKGQTKARILEVNTMQIIDIERTNNGLWYHETRYKDYSDFKKKNHSIDDGKYVHLIAVGNLGVPFSVLIKWTQSVEKLCRESIGEWFDIEIKYNKDTQ